MNSFICRCIKCQEQEEKNAMDLLNKKNIEKIFKNFQRNLLNNDEFLQTKTDLKNNDISEDELQIIEYPYSNKDENSKKKNFSYDNKIKIKKRLNIHLANLPKSNEINIGKNLFIRKNDICLQNNIINRKGDFNELLIVDIDDRKKIKKEKINIKTNININNKKNYFNISDINNFNQDKKKNMCTNFNKIASYKILNNESLKSLTTKFSTLNNTKKKKIGNKSIEICNLSTKRYYKDLNKNSFNYCESKFPKKNNIINLSKTTNFNNNKNNINIQLFKNLFIKKEKEYKLTNIFTSKRIKKKHPYIKKTKIDIKKSKY